MSSTFDTGVFNKAIQGVGEHHTNMIRASASLGIVDQARLTTFGVHDDQLCSFCHACNSSVPHFLWNCTHPDLVSARNNFVHKDEGVVLANFELLPLQIQYGIPTRLTLMPCSPWWTDHFAPDQFHLPLSTDINGILSTDDTHAHDSDFCVWLKSHTGLDAYLGFLALNNVGVAKDSPLMPSRVDGTPSDTPDVFSDGSLSKSKLPFFWLASAGVWCPGRDTPPCDLKLTYALEAAKQGGVALHARIDGYIAYSARTELLDLIAAMYNPGPCPHSTR